MIQRARVVEINGEIASVAVIRQSACSTDCSKCAGGCASKQQIIVQTKNDIGAKAGDFVDIETPSSQILKKAFILYMLPVVAFFVGYIILTALNLSQTIAISSAVALFLLSLVFIKIYDKKTKDKNALPIITKIVKEG